MKIQFDKIQPTVLEHFNGGEGEFAANMFNDGKCKILRGCLAPGCSIGMHTHAKMLVDDTEEFLRPGDCHYCPQGHSHSFINEAAGDLVFYAVVPEHGAAE